MPYRPPGFDPFGSPVKDSGPKNPQAGDVQMYIAFIEGIDESTGLVFCRSPLTGQTFDSGILCHPYMNYRSDEGVRIMPRIGSQVLIAVVDGQTFVLPAYFAPMITEKGSYLGFGRENAHQGDVWIAQQQGSFMEFLSGGIIRIMSHGLAQSIWNPLYQRVLHIARRLLFQTDAGVEEWDSDDEKSWYRKEVTVKPAKETLYRMRINKEEHVKVEIYDQEGKNFFGSIHCNPSGDFKLLVANNVTAVVSGTTDEHFIGTWSVSGDDKIVYTVGDAMYINPDDDCQWVARENDGVEGVTEVAMGHVHQITKSKVKIKEHGTKLKTS